MAGKNGGREWRERKWRERMAGKKMLGENGGKENGRREWRERMAEKKGGKENDEIECQEMVAGKYKVGMSKRGNGCASIIMHYF
jgi:hypothetical protein